MVGGAVCPTGHMRVSWWQDTMDLTFEAVPKDTRKPTLVILAECTAVRLTSRRFRMEKIPRSIKISLTRQKFRCSCDGHDLPWFLRIHRLAPGAVPHGFTFPENYPTDPVAGSVVSWGLGRLSCRCSWGLDCEEHLEQQPGWNSHEGRIMWMLWVQRSILPLEERKKQL